MSESKTWNGLEERWLVDTSEDRPVHLLTGRNGSYLRLSPSAYQLLRLRREGVDFETIAERVRCRQGGPVSAADVARKYEELVSRIEGFEEKADDHPLGFWFRVVLLPEAVVNRIVPFLDGAFRRTPALIFLAFILLTVVGVFVVDLPWDFTGGGFWPAYALLLVSVLVHELGHASACHHFGARPSEIGATIYLVYPALYSDVSSAWRLGRRERVIVDFAGLYFQFIVGALFIVLYAVLGWAPFGIAVLMILFSAVFSLNPIFKFDGYWAVADALGVTNLGQQPFRVLGYYFQKLRGRPTQPLPWPSRTVMIMAVYSVSSLFVWGFFMVRIVPRLWHHVTRLPALVTELVQGSPEGDLSTTLMSLFLAALTFVIAWRLFRSMLLPALRFVVRRARLVGAER